MRRFLELTRHALNGLRRAPLRASLTALGVAISTGALVSMVAFALGLQTQIEAPFRKLGLINDIRVQPKKPKGDETPRALDDAAIDGFAQLPGVELSYPDFKMSQLELRAGDKTETGYAMGLPRQAGLIGILDELLRGGRFFSLSSEPEAILSQRLARRLGFEPAETAIGQKVKLTAHGLDAEDEGSYRFARREIEASVVGVFEPPGFATNLAGNALLLPVDLMRDLPGAEAGPRMQGLRDGLAKGTYAQAVVRTRSIGDVGRVSQAIEAQGFEARSLLGELKEARQFFIFMDVLLSAVGAVALIVAGLGIVNTQLMTVLERTQEIGLYKALGAADGDVRTIFLAEASLVGLAGGCGGLVLARGVSWLLQIGVDAYARTQGFQDTLPVFDFSPSLLFGAVLFAVVVSIESGLYPASRAASIDPIRALRRE
jgi:ABC-type antimicrobial peptide transport system permease subunit